MATASASVKRKPGTGGHTLIVKVISSNPVQVNKPRGARSLSALSQPSRRPRIAECLVGDETGAIYFTVRNDQVDMMEADATMIVRNAKIDMFKGSMRLAVDKWGRIKVSEAANFEVNVE